VLGEIFFKLFDILLDLFRVVLIDAFLLVELFAPLLELGTFSKVVVVKVISQSTGNIMERREINI
jgi:hypothetical protein